MKVDRLQAPSYPPAVAGVAARTVGRSPAVTS